MGLEFHPWEIWNGGEFPYEPQRVQTQRCSETRLQAQMKDVWHSSVLVWDDGNIIAFRRVKQPETVTLTGYHSTSGWIFAAAKSESDTHKLTFIIDNKGNPYNFKCEKIK